MKKIAVITAGLILSATVAFAAPLRGSEELIEKFWTKGSYIKIEKSNNAVVYINKASIAGIIVDEDDYKIASIGYEVWSGENEGSKSFSSRRWKVESDENGNIIITRK